LQPRYEVDVSLLAAGCLELVADAAASQIAAWTES
jgi:hypothetical protein